MAVPRLTGSKLTRPSTNEFDNEFSGYVRNTVVSVYGFAENDPISVTAVERGRWYLQLYRTKMEFWSHYDVILWAIHNGYSDPFIAMLRKSKLDGLVLVTNSRTRYDQMGISESRYVKRLYKHVKRFRADMEFYEHHNNYRNIGNWTQYDMAAWLEDNQMDHFVGYFLEYRIDGTTIMCSNNNDIINWGINQPGDAIIIRRLRKCNFVDW